MGEDSRKRQRYFKVHLLDEELEIYDEEDLSAYRFVGKLMKQE